MEVIVAIWVILSILIGFIDLDKGNSFWRACFTSLLLSPVIGGISVALSDKKPICKYCRSFMEHRATVCKHCGREQ